MKLFKLKKEIKLLIFITLLSTTIFSQNEMRIGVNVGANITDFKGNIIIETADTKIGFLVGAYFEYYITENIALKTNLNYESKAFSSDGFIIDASGVGIEEFTTITKFNYLTLPILIKYDFGTSKKIFVNGGLTFDNFLNAKSKTDGFFEEFGTSTSKLNQLDLNFTIGVGAYFHLDDKNDINLEVRYSPHLTNISKESNVETPTQTNTLSLIASWNLKI
jgi:opacity protein-like surface antigen